MAKMIRSARGEMVDFELLAIKQQIANAPVARRVAERKRAIAIKDGAKLTTEEVSEMENVIKVADPDGFLTISKDGAQESGAAGKQLKRK